MASGARPAIADAGGAAESHRIEVQFVEIFAQARFVQVVGDYLGARREAGLHPWLGLESTLDGVLRQQARAQHQRRIRGVGAAGDGGNHNRAIAQLELVAVVFHLDVLLRCAFHGFREGGLGLPQRHAILRALGAGQSRLNLCQVEFQRVGKERVGCLVGAEKSLQLGVSVDQCDALGAASGEAQIGQCFGIDREKSHSRAVFGSHVGDGGAVRQCQAGKPGSVELDEPANHSLFPQHFGDGQDQVRSRSPFGQPAVQFEADHVGHQHGKRLPEHCGLLPRFRRRPSPALPAR